MLSILLVIYIYVASVPGLPRSVRVLIMRRLRIIKTRTERGRPGTEANIYVRICTYAMHRGIALSAMDSATLNSSAMDLSAMDSSAIGVGVAVLVGKCMQGPCSAVPDIRSIR